MLTVRLFGTPTFELNDQSLASLLTGRTAALFIYLLVTRTPQPRSLLADLLWDQVTEQQAKSNLRYQLRDLRKAVGDYVVVTGETVAFNQELPHWIDVTVFTAYLATASTLSADKVEAEILQELLALYRSELLAGFQVEGAPVFDRWLQAQRRYCHDLVIQALQLRIQQLVTQGEYAAGLAVNRTLLLLEPWREEAHRQRMMLLADSGQRSAALKQYVICCQALQEELDVPPMAETTGLYEQIKAGKWHSSLAPCAPQSPPTISTAPLTAMPMAVSAPGQPPSAKASFDLGAMLEPTYFYGRQSDLALLHSWIGQEGGRLVAILGVAGQGKTALAATFVQEVLEDEQRPAHDFTKVIWRSLQDAPPCTALLQDWLQVLGDGEQAQQSEAGVPTFDQLVSRLFAILQTQRCLLVLDGWEAILSCPTDEDDCTAEQYHPGCEAYSTLLRLLGQRRHRSCVLLTSQIRPHILSPADERQGIFRGLELKGLTLAEGSELLRAQGVMGEAVVYQQLHQRYGGNPLLLHHAATLIDDLFETDGMAFLQEGCFFLGDIGTAPAQQLAKLSPLERQVMRALAAAGQPLQRPVLWQKLSPLPPKEQYFYVLQTLQRSFLVQQENAQFKLPTLLAAYLTERELSAC
ncbi:MAG: NACHT domain-containing protein [Caldilineaceae bacterium]|nr:NACHT domain-containing protein [Caldilineaceae bacterium]